MDLATGFRFAHRLDRPRGGPTLAFGLSRGTRAEASGQPVPRAAEGAPILARCGPAGSETFGLSFGRGLRFRIARDRIDCRLLDPGHAHLVELRLLGPVLALWLELRGIPALHASSVVTDGCAVAFLSGSGGGKSGMAASLLEAGHPLLADDVLPFEPGAAPLARPGYPQMRMWPRDAERFLGSAEGLERIHPRYSKLRVPVGEGGFGRFHSDSAPLGGVYLVERPGPSGSAGNSAPEHRPRIEPLPPHRALIELVRHSFTPRLVEAAGLQPRRLEVLARLVEQVPVRRLVVPSGPGGLEAARDAVLAEI